MGLFGTVILGVGGTIIGKYFQDRTEKNKHHMAQKERELKTAQEIFETVSKKMDLMLYHMMEVYEGYKYDAPDEEKDKRRKDYSEVSRELRSSLNLEFARIKQYFGKKMFAYFKDEIWTRFVAMSNEVKLLMVPEEDEKKNPMDRLEKDEDGNFVFATTGKKLNQAIENFNTSMIKFIQNEKIGILREEDRITEETW